MSARFIDGDFALSQNLLAILQQFAMRHGLVAEQHATQLRCAILEREVNVSRRLSAQIGDLAADPDRADLFFEKPFDLRGEFTDGEHAPRLFGGEQFAEIPL